MSTVPIERSDHGHDHCEREARLRAVSRPYGGGARLAAQLQTYEGRDDVTVLGLPRGGVPVAAEVARRLRAPLDVCVVRKLGVPGHEEFAMGAIASGGGVFLDETLIAELRIRRDQVLDVLGRERAELLRRERAYLGNRPPAAVEGRTVIVVDDGLATGATMQAAVVAIRRRHPTRIIVAVPVAARPPVAQLSRVADEVVACVVPERFRAVGEWYLDFSPTTDAEVLTALASAGAGAAPRPVVIPAGDVVLTGDLVVPAGAPGIVAFAHGSGSSRRSPRNVRVAEALNRAGLGTLLIDLLSPAEEPAGSADPRLRFDIPLLTQRVTAAIDWLDSEVPVVSGRAVRRQHRRCRGDCCSLRPYQSRGRDRVARGPPGSRGRFDRARAGADAADRRGR